MTRICWWIMVSTGSAPGFRTVSRYAGSTAFTLARGFPGSGAPSFGDSYAASMAPQHGRPSTTISGARPVMGPCSRKPGDHRADHPPTRAQDVQVAEPGVEEKHPERAPDLGDELSPLGIPVGVIEVPAHPRALPAIKRANAAPGASGRIRSRLGWGGRLLRGAGRGASREHDAGGCRESTGQHDPTGRTSCCAHGRYPSVVMTASRAGANGPRPHPGAAA